MKAQSFKDWTEKTYVEYGEIVFNLLTVPPEVYQKTQEQVELIDAILKRHHPAAKKLLDIPCGDGRISLELAEKGYEITGVDISPIYIDKACSKTAHNQKARFLVGDMRKIKFDEKFDAVINWFGSFSYFDDETNEKVLQKFIGYLSKGGLLIIDQTNRDYIIQKMGGFYEWHPEIVIREKKRKLFAKYQFDAFTNRINVEVKIENKKDKIYYNMRYYQLHEVAAMLKRRNMKIIEVYGDYRGSKYSLFSPRIIAVAGKER
jgi:D-alanine-D-alanine ligase